MEDYNLWQKLVNSKASKRVALPFQFLFGNREGAKDFANRDIDTFLDSTMSVSAPFRKGANILAQNYGSAFTGKDMSQPENQGKFLQWLAGSITPEEQGAIDERPILEAIKSSAGIVSTLMPFAKAGVVGNVGSKVVNPTLSKFVNLLSRGVLEGGVGGFGYSREGKELQDTLLGMGIGAGGEVLGGLVSDPTFRRGMGQEIMKGGVTPEGRYTAFAKLGDDIADDADNVIDLTKDKLYLEAKKYDTPEEFISSVVDPLYEYNQKDLNIFKDPDIGKGTVKDAISDIGGIKNVERGFIDISQIEPGENININAERAQRALQEIKGGLRVPIIAEPLENGKFLIQDGNNRYIAYKSLGIKEIPIIAPKGSGLKQPKTEDLLNLWEQAHTQYVGEKPKGKRGRFIDILTGEEGDENQMHRLDYKGLKKEPGRISKTPEEDFREELRKTAERWGLYR